MKSLLQLPAFCISLLVAVSPSSAIPIAAPQRIVGLVGSPEQICTLNPGDFHTWSLSGASFFLDGFIADNGPSQWANKLDEMRTASGAVIPSFQRCNDIIAGSCDVPSMPCTEFNPPQLRFVREAMAGLFRVLRAFHEELQDQTLITSLGLGMIENDFTTPQSDVNIAGVIAGAFGIGAAAAAGSPVVGGPLGAISGIFSIISSVDGDQNNVALSISARLTAAFIASQQQLVSIAEAAFGGTADTSILRSVSPLSQGTNMERTDIGKFFAGGRWLFPGSRDVGQEVKQVTERATVRMRQALMIQALKTQGMSVIIDSARNKFEECTPTGSRFINGKCYSIGQRLSGRGPMAVIYIPRAQALKLDNSFYQLNVEEFYMNAEACAKANPNGDGQPPSQGFPLDGSLPPCFFNMDVIDGRGFTDQLSAIGPR